MDLLGTFWLGWFMGGLSWWWIVHRPMNKSYKAYQEKLENHIKEIVR